MARRPLRFMLLAVFASAVALGCVWVGARRMGRAKSAAPSAPSVATAEEVAELRAELAALKRTTSDTRRFVALQAARTAAPAAVARRMLPTPEQARDLRHVMRSSLEKAFSADGADPVWSAETVAAMNRTIAAELPGTRVAATECARTMCRLRLVFKDDEAAAADTERLGDLEPFAAEVQYLPDPDAQPPATTIYVARAGARLPALP